MKVYVLFEGEYSGRSVVGVFTSRDDAAAAANETGSRYGADIQDFELDELAGRKWLPTSVARVDLATGQVWAERDTEKRLVRPDQCDSEGGPGWVRVFSPVSPEHAAKVAAEKRQAWLREQAAGLPA